MVEQEITNREEVRQCVFNNLQIINSLSDGKIPIDLKDRLNYTTDCVEDNTPREIYTDIETGDELFKTGKLFRGLGFFKESVVIKTRVGNYEMGRYYREFGCSAEEYFFNGKETDRETFFEILRKQEKLSK